MELETVKKLKFYINKNGENTANLHIHHLFPSQLPALPKEANYVNDKGNL